MIRWTSAVLKPGGSVIAIASSIRNLEDAHNGTVKDDPRFHYQYRFGEQKKEGLYLETCGQEGDTIEYYSSLFTHNTYKTIFEISGFNGVRFFSGDDFSIDARTCSTDKDIEEQAMFWEYMTWKGCLTAIFTAQKKP